MGKIIQYEHHGGIVSVDEDQKGKHWEHCLCSRCSNFCKDELWNCKIAKTNFEMCKKYNIVTPVFECPKFEGA